MALDIQVVSNMTAALGTRSFVDIWMTDDAVNYNDSKEAAVMTAFADQYELFRAYDIRGARQLFTQEFIQALGRAFAQLYLTVPYKSKNTLESLTTGLSQAYPTSNKTTYNPAKHPLDQSNTVVIGYDARFNSDTIAHTLTHILHHYGLTVIHLGLVTTPMMAFWAERYDGHGIMVTASHSQKDTLGIKWLVNAASPSHKDIDTLYRNLSLKSASKPAIHFANRLVHLPVDTVANTYIEAIRKVLTHIHKPSNNRGLAKLNITLVIDCMHGATSNIAQALFERFCHKVILLNDTPNGDFPTGNPDPTEPNRLAELQQNVMVYEADMGLAFDGDGDRLMIVDNRGKVVAPDHLLYLLAQVAITEREKATTNNVSNDASKEPDIRNIEPQVLFDVKCSHHLPKLLTALGAVPMMTKTGSSLLRRQLAGERQAIFAGELSGHFIFNDGYFIAYDDAMYSGLRLLHWLTYTATINQIPMITQPSTDTNINTNDKVRNNTTANKDIDKQSEQRFPMTTGAWGEPKPLTAPFQLTDITQHLPLMVSTADHYLPLPQPAESHCSIIEHLIGFCHYLQQWVQTDCHSEITTPIILSNEGITVPLPLTSCRCVHSAAQSILAQAHELLPIGTRLSCIDGLRLDFDHGFGVLRKSNTSHSLTVRFAGDSFSDLRDIQSRFVALCRPFYNTLAEQIATICPE